MFVALIILVDKVLKRESTRCFKLLATMSRNVEFPKSFVAFENNGVPKSDPCGTPVYDLLLSVSYTIFQDCFRRAEMCCIGVCT